MFLLSLRQLLSLLENSRSGMSLILRQKELLLGFLVRFLEFLLLCHVVIESTVGDAGLR